MLITYDDGKRGVRIYGESLSPESNKLSKAGRWLVLLNGFFKEYVSIAKDMITKNDLINVRNTSGLALLPLMIRHKKNLQGAIFRLLDIVEIVAIQGYEYNDAIVEKLVILASDLYREEESDENLYALSMSVGTIIKEYEWGANYVQMDGLYGIAQRIEACETTEEEFKASHPHCGVVVFDSSDHIRYQSGIDVSGHNFGCHRQVEIKHVGNLHYIVTIYNMDGIHPVWGNNVQMAPKMMKIIAIQENFVRLRGVGFDEMGGDFSDYGIEIVVSDGEIENIKLNMYDRDLSLLYLP